MFKVINKKNTSYRLTFIGQNYNGGFTATVYYPNGAEREIQYSDITQKFYYDKPSHKLPKYIEKSIVDYAEQQGYKIKF